MLVAADVGQWDSVKCLLTALPSSETAAEVLGIGDEDGASCLSCAHASLCILLLSALLF